MRLALGKIYGYIKNTFVIFLFAWISFFPQPLQDRYFIYARIFLGVFLGVLLLNKDCRKVMFSIRDWPLWAFLLCLSLNIIKASDKKVALGTYFYLAGTLGLLFYIGKGMYHFKKDVSMVSAVVCALSILVSLLAVFEMLFAFDPLYQGFINNEFYQRYITGWVRPMSTLYNPAPLGTYLLFTLPFAAYLVKKKAGIGRVLGAAALILNSFCLIATFSRAAFLGLLSMPLCFFLIKKRYKAFFVILSLIILFVIILSLLPYPINRLGPKGIGIYGTGLFSGYRIVRAKMSLEMFKASPLTGVGLNHFRILFDQYYPAKQYLAGVPYEIKIPDNMWLSLFCETGIVGMVGFLVFIVSLFKGAFKKAGIFIIPSLSLIGLLFNMAGYELLYWASPYMLFCLACGFIQGAAITKSECQS
jgi:O-antigen ligase